MRKHTRFVNQGGGRNMRGHEARFQARLPGEKCGKAFTLIRINEPIRSAFGHAHEIDNRDCSVIERKGEWRTMKISARDDISTFSEDEWVISR